MVDSHYCAGTAAAMACRLLWPYALLCSHSSSSYWCRLLQVGLASSSCSSGLAMLVPVPLQDSKTMAQQQQQEQQTQRACECQQDKQAQHGQRMRELGMGAAAEV